MPARGQLVNHTISVYPDIEKSERTPLPPQLSEFRIQRSEIRNQKLERTPLPPLTRGLARWRNDTVTGGETNQNKASVTCRSCERREGSLPPSKRHFVPFCHLPRQREERVHLTFDFYRSRDACPCRTVNGRARRPAPTLVSTDFLYSVQTETAWLTNRHFPGGRGSLPLRGQTSDLSLPPSLRRIFRRKATSLVRGRKKVASDFWLCPPNSAMNI